MAYTTYCPPISRSDRRFGQGPWRFFSARTHSLSRLAILVAQVIFKFSCYRRLWSSRRFGTATLSNSFFGSGLRQLDNRLDQRNSGQASHTFLTPAALPPVFTTFRARGTAVNLVRAIVLKLLHSTADKIVDKSSTK